MNYTFSFYKEEDFDALENLVIKNYEWDYPVVGISRVEFCRGLHPKFAGFAKAWEHTMGMYWEEGQLAACVWNEGVYDGEVFFLFDKKERADDVELLKEMINFAKMYGVRIDGDVRSFDLFIPGWSQTLLDLVKEMGLQKGDWADHKLVRPFSDKKMDVVLPEGYRIVDGNTTPAFYLSNVHRMAFGYGKDDTACEHGAEAFEDVRAMKHYDKDLDLCILDPMGRPVAIAIIWYDPRMPYCELEPLGVVWWERRKGLGSAILNEATNRVKAKYPDCKGMLGGDQQFYQSIGYEEKNEVFSYHWEKEIIISWDARSKNMDYTSEMNW